MSVEPAQSRYVLPSFVERTSYGVKESNPYNKLFEERIIFLGVQIDDASANDVMAPRVSQFLSIMSRRRPRRRGRPGFLAGWPAQGMGERHGPFHGATSPITGLSDSDDLAGVGEGLFDSPP